MKRLDKLCGNCAIWRQIPQNPAAPDEGVSGWCHLIPKPQEKRVGHFCSEWRGENGERYFPYEDPDSIMDEIEGLKDADMKLHNRICNLERSLEP